MADPTLPEIRPIEGFENYGVSADGRVWRLTRASHGPGRNRSLPWALRQHPHKDGYLCVILFRGDGSRNTRMVATLVLEAFVGPRPTGFVAAHNNGVRDDNRGENLRWATQASNIADKARHGTLCRGERMHCAKLTDSAVREIRKLPRVRKLQNGTLVELSERFGVSTSAIRAARRGKTWRHVDAREPVAAWDQE